MSNPVFSNIEHLAGISAKATIGGSYFPNPDDPGPWPWPIGPIIREAWKVSVLEHLASRHLDMNDFFPWPRPNWDKTSFKEKFARAVASESISFAAVIEQIAERRAELLSNYLKHLTHAFCHLHIPPLVDLEWPPKGPQPPQPPCFDDHDLFIIGQEYKKAAARFEDGALKEGLLKISNHLLNMSTGNIVGEIRPAN
ncbi:MAG: hypothetical protein JO154_09730 [Chitinophaga sp.]|uniref:hypothetical protein n=1 Tax=Chitinophaga sp. TaxID=1869181 RepID=UPI0025B8BD7A|nr:hypothetical protein [Chitinophaga sp.]MBV8252871.1 hypothetical protein [Chitinophaga sp.]